MRGKVLALLTLIMVGMAPLCGGELYPALLQKVAAVYTYEGNSLNEFKGDIVVVLSDGSSWKVHARDRDDFIWNFSSGDPVFISWRTSGYWSSRDHHLCLNNLLNQKVQPSVMLVGYPKTAATVVKVENSLPQRIHLSDGSVWAESHAVPYRRSELRLRELAADTKVYVGLNRFGNGRYSYFLTSGGERDAKMIWVDRVQ